MEAAAVFRSWKGLPNYWKHVPVSPTSIINTHHMSWQCDHSSLVHTWPYIPANCTFYFFSNYTYYMPFLMAKLRHREVKQFAQGHTANRKILDRKGQTTPISDSSGRSLYCWVWNHTIVVVVQSLSCVWLFVTTWTAACQASLSFTITWSLLKLTSSCPLLLLPWSFPASESFLMSRLFASGGQSIGASAFSISPSKEYSGLISFRIDWLDLLVVQGTLKSLLQHHSSKALILQRSAFFMVQLSHPYMTTGKTVAVTIRPFVGKVMSLLLNTLSRFVIAFLPRSKCLLISCLQSPSAVILEPK